MTPCSPAWTASVHLWTGLQSHCPDAHNQSIMVPSGGHVHLFLSADPAFWTSEDFPASSQPAHCLPLPLLPRQCSLHCHRPQQLLVKQPLGFGNSFHKLQLTRPLLSYCASSAEAPICVPRIKSYREGRKSTGSLAITRLDLSFHTCEPEQLSQETVLHTVELPLPSRWPRLELGVAVCPPSKDPIPNRNH